jgi:hypothetical protein
VIVESNEDTKDVGELKGKDGVVEEVVDTTAKLLAD